MNEIHRTLSFLELHLPFKVFFILSVWRYLIQNSCPVLVT